MTAKGRKARRRPVSTKSSEAISASQATVEVVASHRGDQAEGESSWAAWSPFGWALAAGLLIWASLPPLGWWPLSIAAGIPLYVLVLMPSLPGRRPYRQIWLASFLQAALIYQFVRLAHPANYISWGMLALYVSLYLPLVIAVSRALVHRGGWSGWVALPLVWLCGDLLRGYVLTGFSVGFLAHSLVRVPVAIQVADLIGDLGLSALLLFWGAVIACCLGVSRHETATRARVWLVGALGIGSLAFVLGYGQWRLNAPVSDDVPTARVAIIQGSVDTLFPATQAESDAYWSSIEQQYREGTQETLEVAEGLDLILWPESKFTALDFLPLEGNEYAYAERRKWLNSRFDLELFALKAQGIITTNDVIEWIQSRDSDEPLTEEEFSEWKATQASGFVPMLVGAQSANFSGDKIYNSALHLDGNADVANRYFKNHLVMFGEYIPGADWFPVLYQLGPVAGGLTAGERALAIESGGLRFAPSICFETTLSRVVRRQVRELSAASEQPDVLVNLTDDGWFWGSSALDFHLACNVFRSVEMRTPMLVAANTGLSAWIDGRGRIRQEGPRRERANLVVDVAGETLSSPWLVYGDLPVWLILGVVVCGWCLAIRRQPVGSDGDGAGEPELEE